MSDNRTIARPYAKAVFAYALAKNQLVEWSGYLNTLAVAVLDRNASEFIVNPASTVSQHCELLMDTVKCVDPASSEQLNNLLQTLAHNRRLLVLPQIRNLYEILRCEQEKTISVNVSSYHALSEKEQHQLIESLSKRLQRKVDLNINIDKNLIGGAVIQAGDLVIDGSVRGKIEKLRTGLAA